MDDALIQAAPEAMTRIRFDYKTTSLLPPNRHFVNGFGNNHEAVNRYQTNAHISSASDYATSSSSCSEVDSSENSHFQNPVLKYINDILMEEELESNSCKLHDCSALQAAEKSFYDVLGQRYPPPSDQSFDLAESSWIFDLEFSNVHNSAGYLENTIQVPDLYSNNTSLIPLYPSNSQKQEYNCLSNGSRERKQHQPPLDGRSNKHSAFSVEKSEEIEMFDILLNQTDSGSASSSVSSSLQNSSADENLKNKAQKKGSKSNRRTSRKKQGNTKREVVDLWTLLPQCAQAVANDDQKTAKELLKQISQYSSPYGDGNQRLAHCFANGLEARMAGTGTPGYTPAVRSITSAADMLKGYYMYVTACPFMSMSFLYANETILKLAEKVSRLHIIDFGILYGFQWFCLIEQISTRIGGPPKLCITGIEFPQPGFRPTERVEETGRRIRKYCERFNVPFEYNSIAQKWDTIHYEDLKIDRTELIVVNCLYRLKNLPDDTMVVNSVRDKVLNLIRRISPDIFIHGVVNGTYNAPFFLTRFRDALFHFSAIFDLLDNTVPREEPERVMFEKETYGRYAINVIACEGWERIERPETYRQWQTRNQRAGFKQIPLDQDLVKKVKTTVKSNFNKNFNVDEDSQWMLQGWKGRIIYALSVWKPVYI
ncbi:scarecrow-like protein 14 [Euphorbia lathyris]|uniref:scarecrow-like protein 14 n=1 Tax=Euphorbia lathyris TaxID=212925 RepID=UPI003313F84F